MTGGRVVVLGATGRNFGAGMSGGVAYVLDEKGDFPANLNKQMVDLEVIDDQKEQRELFAQIERHYKYTGSQRAKYVLENWDRLLPRFVKVLPRDYKRMLACLARAHDQGLTGDDAVMVAFEENARDLARVGGN
jgi:glutamate synthase domain-containing protein 3